MDFLLALFLSASGSPPPVKAELRARASVTILRAHRASPNSWGPAAHRNQKEIVTREKDGTPILLRLTEFE